MFSNSLINVGDDDLGVPSSNSSTYSTNSVTTNSTTLYTIESDEIGNITNINDVAFNWNGRRLESVGVDGFEYISYEYNIDGQRIKKTAPDLVTGETQRDGSFVFEEGQGTVL